jgi:Tfp pilus assembly protein PilX
MSRIQRESGAVSLFIVIFTTLLVTIITVGFTQLVLKNQSQVTNADLSQSAYDTALVGIEDAKRVLVLDKKCEAAGGTLAGVNCTNIATAVAANNCNTISKGLDGTNSTERKVTTNSGSISNDETFDQATTCVKITQNAPNYRRTNLSSARSHLIPLQVEPGKDFRKVEISWFTKDDIVTGDGTAPEFSLPFGIDSVGNTRRADGVLPTSVDNGTPNESWGVDTPPLLRAQLIKTSSSFSLADFDNEASTDATSKALFLYPKDSGLAEYSLNTDLGRSGKTPPKSVSCEPARFTSGGYACKTTIDVGETITSGERAYLRLSALYASTRYQLVLKDSSGNVVDFYGIQSVVDSTGRTNDVFRRVEARVQLNSTDYPYPEQALYLYGDLCKDMFVTNKGRHYDKGRCEY